MVMQFASRGPHAGKAFWGCSQFPRCRGSRDAEGNAPRPRHPRKTAATPSPLTIGRRNKSLSRGDLLVSSDNRFGPGKLVAKEGDKLVLEYFDAPGPHPSDRYRGAVSRGSLSRLPLSPELRVFWQDLDDQWRSGRILEVNEHNDIYVRGHEWEGFVPEERLYVRWSKPLADPVGFAEAGMLESPILAELRLPFLRSILQQRSATHGMSAVLSSCIELHSHQVETAWRVLQDPVQRYLLADEVGLGKTIEAGIIIRQMLLDKPQLRVQLILPPFLLEQWKRELTQKFRVHDFTRSRIRFSRDDDPASWEPSDILVVDEAHNLARMSISTDPALAARFERLHEVALATPRLLLLSATPALHNEGAFLAMLKLLDPVVYADTTAGQLRSRLEARAGLGRVFLGLQPGLPGVLLNGRLAEIETEFPDDNELAAIVGRAREAVAAQDKEQTATLIQALRTHVAEVYRVHRRMLRTRRTTALEGTYRVSGRRSPEPVLLGSSSDDEVTEVLERWREQALAQAEGDPAAMTATGRAFSEAVSLTLDPSALRAWSSNRAAGSIPHDERSALRRLEEDLSFTDRRRTVSRPFADALSELMTSRERAVVFCPTSDLGAEVADELEDLLGAKSVFRHLSSEPSDQTERAVRRFEATRTGAVLVADSSAEEGRNLQFADVLVHLGLPESANRLEQRIGRCDRWSPEGADEWRSYVVSGDRADSYIGAWARILAEGFGIFENSVASLQQAVDDATDEAWGILLQRGLDGVDAAVTRVRELLDAEIERVREQDALDSLETSTDDRSVYARISDAESGAQGFARVSDELLAANSAAGNLRFERIGNPIAGLGGYESISRLPGKQAQIPLIPASRLVRDFLPLQGHRGTFVREVSLEREDVHLYRYGDQFIDAVSDFLWHDDRGRAFGMWRWLPDWAHDDTPVYRFDYAVEANPLEAGTAKDPRGALVTLSSGIDELALIRRADGIFPPIIVSVWMTAAAEELTSSVHLDALAAPYAKPRPSRIGGDYALNRVRIAHAYELIPAVSWGKSWRTAEAAAQGLVRDRDDVSMAVDRANAIATRDATTRLSKLRLRAARSSGSELALLEEELRREEVIAHAMSAAMSAPTLRLDSTGIVVLSGRALTS
ncbi:ATP-dependent helicase HepA [Phycicoccus badiiscoriae]|uniref:ATP-dependent helicase HepA n=1 Tax=Pedococcus badiiscoriae TaxID=642776 RepID=A0A852WG34_9MICO|nr:protein DpdE [Pedococcus badiiscoriae]NYG07750.1 ATP-dependent helicase HepA [Pedococcus badiiscoriae]